MRILYLLKHFPCLSQTFVLHEIRELARKGFAPYVVSAIDPREDRDPAELPELGGRITYLEHDYLYRYAPTGKFSDREAIDKAERMLDRGAGDVDRDTVREIFEIVSRHEADVAVRARGFLECVTVLSLILREGMEHVHCDFGEENVKLAYLLRRAAGVPFSVKLRAYDIFAEPQEDLLLWLSAARRVLTISEYNREFIHRELGVPRERITVIYDGIPVDRLRPSSSYRTSPFVIVSVGRLVEKKGYPYLIEVCRILSSLGISFECSVYGAGPRMGELRRQIDLLGLNDKVRLLGARRHSEIMEALGSASAFVLPCIVAANGDRDATPNVLLEAMARMIPVISTRISGIPEIIDDGVDGILVEPGDPKAIASALAKIRESPVLADALRVNGRRKVERRFGIERNVEELIDALSDRAEGKEIPGSLCERSASSSRDSKGIV